jgi:hypothetical protein
MIIDLSYIDLHAVTMPGPLRSSSAVSNRLSARAMVNVIFDIVFSIFSKKVVYCRGRRGRMSNVGNKKIEYLQMILQYIKD